MLLSPAIANAQMKVGSNPTTLAADTNLQVEATTNVSGGGQFVVQKSTGNVGVGTISPANKLHIGTAAVANTAGIRTPLTNATSLATNANGDIVAGTAAVSCTCGDIKTGLQTADHGSWKLLDGRTHSCGDVSTSANTTTTATYAASGGTLGSVNGSNSKTIARNQLPNVPVTGSISLLRAGQGWTNNNSGVLSLTHFSNTVNRLVNNDVAGTGGADINFNWNLNNNVTQQTLDITPRSLTVNYFMCVN
jgi:hypothetical protein